MLFTVKFRERKTKSNIQNIHIINKIKITKKHKFSVKISIPCSLESRF
jgi:hypothetical protein